MGKIISLDDLPRLLISEDRSKALVLVTGCFDLLHQGHKEFLKAARKQGDVLVLGLESDKRVRQLKGTERPVNKWQKRAVALASLNAVDFIFALPENFAGGKDHLRLLQLIKPAVLAVSENTPHLKKKENLIRRTGGKIFIYPFQRGYSSTSLLTKSE